MGSISASGDFLAELDILDTALATESVSGSIQVIGDLLNNVSIAGGEVGFIEVLGDIGTVTSPITIEGEAHFERIEAEAIYADIDLGTGLTSSGGRLNRLITNSGPYVGDLSCLGLDILGDGFSGLVQIQTDFDGNITVFEKLNETSDIFIGNDFKAGSTISLPHEGLEGQIIINANGNDPVGEWLGEIIVRASGMDPAITLSGPGYTDLIEDVGGGAAGEAGFRLHQESSDPPMSGATPGFVFVTSYDPWALPEPTCDSIGFDAYLQFYGPIVEDDEVSGESVLIERYDSGSSMWIDVTSDFTIDVANDGPTDRRLLLISDDDWFYNASYNHSYRVSRVDIAGNNPSRLQSADVNGTPDVQDFDNGTDNYFYFDTGDGCGLMMLSHFDQDDDSDLTSADIAAWSSNPVDLDGDTDADSTDLYRLTQAISRYDSYRD